MATRVETTLNDLDMDGVYSRSVSTIMSDEEGKVTNTILQVDDQNDGIYERAQGVNYEYCPPGDLWGRETQWSDFENDGVIDYESTASTVYYSEGKPWLTSVYSPDYNGEGNPDHQSVMTYAYDPNGQVSSKETIYYPDGVQSTLDYRIESFTYNTKGLLSEFRIDDWSTLDFEIAWKYSYNSANQLTKVTYSDPYVFGDEDFHVAEVYKYKNGRLSESNIYDEFMNGTHVLEVKTKFEYNSKGLVKKETAYGQDWDWHTVEKEQTEKWYNALNQLDTQLTSFDEDLNGIWDAGTRTLERWTYHDDGSVATHTVDANTGDNVYEYMFSSELLVA